MFRTRQVTKGLILVLGLVATLGAACSSPKPLPEVTIPDSAPAPPPASAPQTTPSDPAAKPARQPSKVVVIDPGGDDRPRTLAEASRVAKERRRQQGQPAAVATIDNENLSEYAEKGSLTFAEPDAPTEVAAASTAPQGGAASAATETGDAGQVDAESEDYWRGEARRLREDWSAAEEEIVELEERVNELRNRFYAEDDPYVRDNRVKPEWDRALDRLAETRQEAKEAEAELDDFLDRGRRAGALPGWLREGIELEPEGRDDEGADSADGRPALEPTEPTIVEDPRS